ncbi:hypothetical protein DET61_11696 [Marinobacter nauticus]|jgi:EAL domain-containing protein (putative c-di-GMP-specific phosphodiesterase class I)|uniref:EAL domain-containing protein n=1 Tax=Marinobacter nauticus TaxID=2743 RepID=A0A368X894_MARNT|nr:hypothetical protein [Marinobacter nauticus]RCW64055.1 hypothetical protein DET61_11696 [Marinobacter nauticus]|tara:strand:+ start:2820 stop:3479 length:660 start_codon:yes stop_codon:yes gene_type:complete
MSRSAHLFGVTSVKAKKTVALATTIQDPEQEINQLHECPKNTIEDDLNTLTFIQEAEKGWNQGLKVIVFVSTDTLDSDADRQKWIEEVKKSHAVLNEELIVLVQSKHGYERLPELADCLNGITVTGVSVGLDVKGGMTEALEWRNAFPWSIVKVDLGNCRSEFSQFAVYLAGLHKDAIDSLVCDVYDRSELIMIEQLYTKYAVGRVYGKNGCLWRDVGD